MQMLNCNFKTMKLDFVHVCIGSIELLSTENADHLNLIFPLKCEANVVGDVKFKKTFNRCESVSKSHLDANPHRILSE